MKRINFSAKLILTLTVLTVLAACLHLTTSAVIAENTLLIRSETFETTISFSTLPLTRVTGETVNGKGETKSIVSDGIALKDLLISAGLDPLSADSVTVTAADEYSASITAEELNEENKVFLILRDDKTLQLVVFGDENSRRNVHDVAIIEYIGKAQ